MRRTPGLCVVLTGLSLAAGGAGQAAAAMTGGPPPAPIRLGWISEHGGTDWLRRASAGPAPRVRLAFAWLPAEPRAERRDASPGGGSRPSSSVPPSPSHHHGELSRFGIRFGHDLKALATSPARLRGKRWGLFGGALAAVGAARLLDDDVRRAVRRGEAGEVRLAQAVRPLGTEGGIALLGLTWAVGELGHKPGWTAVAEDGIEATVLSAGIVTPLVKLAAGRSRPNAELGSSSFRGGESFPSGEVTQAFAIASVLAAHSHHAWSDGLAWGAASVVAWERLRLDAHWFSDAVAGGLLGASIGRWVVRRNHPDLRDSGPRWAVTPAVGAGSYGVGATIAF